MALAARSGVANSATPLSLRFRFSSSHVPGGEGKQEVTGLEDILSILAISASNGLFAEA